MTTSPTGAVLVSRAHAPCRGLRPALHSHPGAQGACRPNWIHEIKQGGYRLQVRRAGDALRLFTRRGHDWPCRYPAITLTPMQLRADSYTLDGQAVVCGPDGVAIFDALHRRGTVSEAVLYALDLPELDGEDLRALSLSDR
jgi:bifunctional non-homologous end joining protein LigD